MRPHCDRRTFRSFPAAGSAAAADHRRNRRTVEETRLAQNESGLAPTTEGWFAVNVGEAAWLDHDV